MLEVRNAPRQNPHWLVTFVAVFLLLAQDVAARQPAAADSLSVGGHGESYWGTILPRSDSLATEFNNIATPVWQHIADFPYHVISAPIRLVFYGIGGAVIYLDESGMIHRVARIIGPRDIPYGAVLNISAGGLAGFGGGFTMVHDEFFGPDNRFRLGFKSSVTGRHRVTLGMRFGLGHATSWQLGAGYRMTANARYFGTGPASKTGNNKESFYRQELSWFGATCERMIAGDLRGELDVRYTQIQARGPRDEDNPAIEDVYGRPPGYGVRSDGITVAGGFTHDSTDDTGRPDSGGLHRVFFSHFTRVADNDSTPDFWTTRIELQQFVPLWYSKRSLALRAFYTRIDPVSETASGEIAFQRLMTNDDPDLFRGYRDFRWRDRGMASFTVEYRWPIWVNETVEGTGLDGYLFSDLGQVFRTHEDLSYDNLTQSYGGGIRLINWNGFVGRLEYGWSEDDYVIRLRADQVFQFQKGGLFYGRNPIPSR